MGMIEEWAIIKDHAPHKGRNPSGVNCPMWDYKGEGHYRGLTGFNRTFRERAMAEQTLAWLEGDRREELHQLMLKEDENRSNEYHLHWMCEELTTYELAHRYVMPWEVVNRKETP